jgi:hypothetical protein
MNKLKGVSLMKKRIFTSVLAICALCLVFSQTESPALACSCIVRGVEQVQRDFQEADVVFIGEIVSQSRVTRLTPDGYTHEDTTYTFAVSKTWKGVDSAQVNLVYSKVIGAPAGGYIVETSCDPHEGFFGGRMFVYAAYTQIEDVGSVLVPLHGGGPCGGTHRVTYFEDEVREVNMLDMARNASLQVGMPATGEATHDGITIILLAGICLAGGLVVRRYLTR